ncbi:heme-binding protein [Humibacter sp. BT305]|nr:heme-binding protein [Humibacter sp. BT305]
MSMAQISPIILSLETAHVATTAAIQKVEEIGIPYTLSVVDGAGNLVHLTRLDGAAIASIDTSVAKARTSVYFGAPTADLAGAVSNGAPLATIQTSTTLPLAFVAGGVPITDADGVVVGAFGAGGGSPEQDHEVAAAAVAALKA